MRRDERALLISVILATVLVGPVSANAGVENDPEPLARCTDTTTQPQLTLQGRLNQRTCVVAGLEHQRFDAATPGYADVRQYAHALADFYTSRAGRQQAMIDTGSGFTALGTLGYALSGPAGAMTQNYWGYSALLPVLLVEFNANEPTRDLYFAGRIGTDLVTDRYALLDSRITLLNGLAGGPDGTVQHECEEINSRIGVVSGWAEGDHRTGLLPVLVDLGQRCRLMQTGAAQGDVLKAHANAWKDQWPRAFAADLLQLHHNLTERDYQLRTSPSEALTLLVSTPLRRLDTLVSGENTQAALDTLKVQNALNGMGFSLTPIAMPDAPALMPAFAVVPAVEARLSALPVPAVKQGGRVVSASYDPGDTARWIQGKIAALEARRLFYNQRARLLQELRMASQRDQLDFSYNVTGHRVEVALREPAPAPLPPPNAVSPAAVR